MTLVTYQMPKSIRLNFNSVIITLAVSGKNMACIMQESTWRASKYGSEQLSFYS